MLAFLYPNFFNTDKTLLVILLFKEFRLLPEFLTNDAAVGNKASCAT